MNHRSRPKHLLVVLAALAFAVAAHAAPARDWTWTPVGPPGGNVRALAGDPQTPERVYLGTGDGVLYRSDDGGRRWARLHPGFPHRGCSLDEIAVGGSGVVYVGFREVDGHGGGVARSADGGRTFTLCRGIGGESVRALAIAPSDERVIAAGTLSGVFLSRDGGASWARISPADHPDLRNIESLAFDPRDARALYAGTWHLPWKTSDGGATWTPAHRGMIDDSDVMTLTVDRSHPHLLYATACTGIYRSNDGAMSWSKLGGIPESSRRTRAFARSPDDPNLLLAGTTEGVWVSEDRGVTWRLTTSRSLVVNAVVVQPDGTIILGTDEAGVLRSADHGATWVESNAGFNERFVSRQLFDPVTHRVVVAAWGVRHHGGVFVADEVFGPWRRIGDGLEGREVLSLALLGDAIVAGTDSGLFTLPAGADRWLRLPTRLDGREVNPRVTDLVASPGRLVAATASGLMFSADAGRTWTQSLPDSGGVAALAASPADPDVVIAVTRQGFYGSADGGASWTPAAGPLAVTPHALAFVPGQPRALLLTTSGGLYRSHDLARSWQRVDGGAPHADLTGLAVNPDGRTIYVSDFTRGGIFRSTDGGASWSRATSNGLASDRVWLLGINPAAPDQVVAAAAAGGLHVLVPVSTTTGPTSSTE